ncbi:hypothetical protein BKA70DRAFT_676373 [Coprinopsis sp. MPI-PUGE-AT-0042]|nr:hypothetical protein BKA70DRAFT_676373 [Coprinopsis sp. MPI-PUGE-AT-0042]
MIQTETPLRTLILPSQSHYPLVLKDLEYISKKAIGLETLALAVNSSLDTIKIPVEIATKSTIRTLKISDARYQANFAPMEYSKIAQFFDCIVPNLQSMEVHKDSRGVGGAHEEHWRLIEHLRQKEKLLRLFARY